MGDVRVICCVPLKWTAKSEPGETREYKITGSTKNLDALEMFFHWIQALGKMGHSGTAEIFVDGDGNAHLDIEGINEGNAPTEEEWEEEAYNEPELRIGLD